MDKPTVLGAIALILLYGSIIAMVIWEQLYA